jgi:hypothetical protein
MLFCENNALKQKTVHSSTDYYVHELLYNAAKQILRVNASAAFVIKQSNDFNLYMLLSYTFQ